MQTLLDVVPGGCATVKRITAEKNLQRRLSEMGFGKGSDIKVIKSAPLGDPIEVIVKGTNISLRKEEASKIFIEQKICLLSSHNKVKSKSSKDNK